MKNKKAATEYAFSFHPETLERSQSKAWLLQWLREEDEDNLNLLWQAADDTRRRYVGDAVHLRGIIEISNYCQRSCRYCGINVQHKGLTRYQMSADEIIEVARNIKDFGYGTVVLQSGEHSCIETAWVSAIIRRIKAETAMAVTLSLGERPADDYAAWKEAGADRYLLKIETSDQHLFNRIHPPFAQLKWKNRLEILQALKEMGYETGSGIMIGIPGQTYDILAEDLLTLKELDLDMFGLGPFIAHPATPLYEAHHALKDDRNQVPNSELMTYKVNALARILCPQVNIPTTTALATLNRRSGRELGLRRGANVIMPNMTPLHYRQLYDIYPQRVCLEEYGPEMHEKLLQRIGSLGRTITRDSGASPHYRERMAGQTVTIS
jgi:biotin synthase